MEKRNEPDSSIRNEHSRNRSTIKLLIAAKYSLCNIPALSFDRFRETRSRDLQLAVRLGENRGFLGGEGSYRGSNEDLIVGRQATGREKDGEKDGE